MTRVEVKPIGINVSYQGRRFLSPIGKKFKEHSKMLIRKSSVPEGPLLVKLQFGFSNKQQDADSSIKSCLDILQERLSFNDNMIYRIEADKIIVPKGKEYWAFEITQHP